MIVSKSIEKNKKMDKAKVAEGYELRTRTSGNYTLHESFAL
jgi:hypothetical protein